MLGRMATRGDVLALKRSQIFAAYLHPELEMA
jgi:hypothetical protein